MFHVFCFTIPVCFLSGSCCPTLTVVLSRLEVPVTAVITVGSCRLWFGL